MLFWLDKDVGLVCALEGAEGCAMLRMLRTLKRQRRIETSAFLKRLT